eukprot:gene12546-15764_t
MPDSTSGPAGAFPSDSMVPSPADSASSSDCCTSNQSKLIHNYVPHYRQHFNWDCGLTCVLMVLKAVGALNCNHQNLRQLCPTTSIWTVDLAHLLRRFGFDVWFFTVTIGPNPDFANESFYMENMKEDEEDELRVSQLFTDASKAGIMLQQRSLSELELRHLLLNAGCIVIMLLDRRHLDPGLCNEGGMLPNLCALEPVGYMGHYVLLVGFDSETMQRIGIAALDLARRSFGTDEDLLVVSSPRIRDHAVSVAKMQSIVLMQFNDVLPYL